MRHLLAHTSGIDGDIFTDTGRGDDCLEKYVAQLSEAAQNHPLGATWSYCNLRLLAGRPRDRAGHGRHLGRRDPGAAHRPLGLEHTGTLPEEAMLHRTAVGHIGEPGEEPARLRRPGGRRGRRPGRTDQLDRGDVLAFARLHLTGGLCPDGTSAAERGERAAMTEKQADVPDKYILGDSWGIG